MLKNILSKTVWGLKQLLPLRYISEYKEGTQSKLTIWRMWFGRTYDIKDYNITV